MINASSPVRAARGRLAFLTPGMGAVASTLYAGVLAINRGLAKPIGSHSQLGKLKLSNGESVNVRDRVPLTDLTDIVFGGWDIFNDDAYESAVHAAVLEPSLLAELREPLSAIKPMPAVFDPNFVRRLNGTHVKTGPTKMDLVDQLRRDIRQFMADHDCDRAVVVWCASTEVYNPPGEAQSSLDAFERGLRTNDASISPSQMYAYAALREGVPYANGSPNVSVEVPALRQLAEQMQTPIAGSDFKTGQTLLKTVLAPGLRNRCLGVAGWYSTNILGNRDGEVLDDPGSFRSKEVSKSGVLGEIFSARAQPDLYANLSHVVKINYYPPRGDSKESWDSIDIFGWLGYPMQIKVNFLCRDSILAAPVALDVGLYLDLAARAGMVGNQDWLSFNFKAPLTAPGEVAEHDFFAQLENLGSTLRSLVSQPATLFKAFV